MGGHDSGIFPDDQPQWGEMNLTKAGLEKIKVPLIYILGGPNDVAYKNGVDDVVRLNRVPVALASLDVGHGGTFLQPNGGKAVQIAIHWLDWQLKHDRRAERWFVGADCTLCVAKDVTYRAKHLASMPSR